MAKEKIRLIAYLRRLAPKTAWFVVLGLFAVLAPQPHRIEKLLSGQFEWGRLASFAIFILIFCFAVAALDDWFDRRMERKPKRK